MALAWIILTAVLQTVNPPGRTVAENLALLTGRSSGEARRVAAQALVAGATPEICRSLADLLRPEGEATVQIALCGAISGSESPPASLLEGLARLLGSANEEVAQAAGAAIGCYDRTAAVPILQRVAADPHRRIRERRAAMSALAELGSTYDAAAALARLLDDPRRDVQEAALQALEQAGQTCESIDKAREWWRREQSRDPAARSRAWVAMQERRQRRADSRLGALSHRLMDRLRAEYLATADAQKPARLVAFLNDPEPAVRRLGLELTNGLITDRKPVPPEVAAGVRARLTDSDSELRRSAVLILGDVRDPADLELLATFLPREPYGQVRAAAVRAMARIGDGAGLPRVRAALADPSTEVVAEAANGIGLLAERVGLDASLRASIAAELRMRLTAAAAPEELVIPVLETLRLLADPASADLLMQYARGGKSTPVRQAAIRAAAALEDERLTDAIVALLSDESAPIRLVAARELGRCAKTDAQLGPLYARLTGSVEPSENVRAEAGASLAMALARRGLREREHWAQRISADVPVLGAALTADLIAGLTGEPDGETPERERMLRLLGDAQWNAARFDAAAATYAELRALDGKPDAPTAARWVRALLRSGDVDRTAALLAGQIEPNASAPASRPAVDPDILAAMQAAAIEELRDWMTQDRTAVAMAAAEQLLDRAGATLRESSRSALKELVDRARAVNAPPPASQPRPASATSSAPSEPRP